MRTNVIATLEEMRLRTELVSVDRDELTLLQECSQSVDPAATPMDVAEKRQRTTTARTA